MGLHLLIIDGVTVPLYASTEISQRYAPLEASSITRMASGTARKQTLAGWVGKVTTEIFGNGLIPSMLGEDAIDYSVPLTVSCIAHRSIVSASSSIAISSKRRTDAGNVPYGRALVGDRWVNTPCSMVGDVATLTPVSGATQYQAVWFPELTMFLTPPREGHPQHGPNFDWIITGEEQ